MFFKKQLFATTSTEQKSKVLDILRQNNIKYYLKTKDNFGGGMFSELRLKKGIRKRSIFFTAESPLNLLINM